MAGERRPSFTDEVKHHLAAVRAAAVLEEVDALPRPEDEPAAREGDGKRNLSEGGPDMGRHVIRSLAAVHGDVTGVLTGVSGLAVVSFE